MQLRWQTHQWNNNPRCPIVSFKGSLVKYQGSHEFAFLERFENMHGIEWVNNNITRGPAIWYKFHNSKKLYISDFLIGNTIYEIKSNWTWNKHGKDIELENKNKAKLTECVVQGYNVMLVLDGKDIEWH